MLSFLGDFSKNIYTVAKGYIFAIASTGAVFTAIYIIALGLTLFFDYK